LQELSRFLSWPANGHDRRHHGSRYLRQPHAPRAPQGAGGANDAKPALETAVGDCGCDDKPEGDTNSV
jgi:putative (di)nucleoside polyphosphate hydrolase